MPRGDRTGPDGMGPMTGRAAGYCAGYNQPGFTNPVAGRGRGRGLGRGYGRGFGAGYGGGWRNWFNPFGFLNRAGATHAPQAAPTQLQPEMEKQTLGEQARALQEQLDMINKRLDELSSSSD